MGLPSILAVDSPAKPCDTMHGNAAAGFLSKFGVEQLEPVVHDLGWGRGAVVKGPVLERVTTTKIFKYQETLQTLIRVFVVTHQNLNALLLHWSLVVGGFTYSHQRVHGELF